MGRELDTKRKARQRLPAWLRVKLPGRGHYYQVRKELADLELNTVCQEARCPNVAECWGCGTATFMILGKICTRACRFCEVQSGRPTRPPDEGEPERLARAVAAMTLKYVVITSVDRDDLTDFGAGHFVETVAAIKAHRPEVTVELLTPDFQGAPGPIGQVATCGAEVIGQNIETVARLSRQIRDRRSGYRRTLDVLAAFRRENPALITKSSLLLGLGETEGEVLETLDDLRQAGVDWVTLGQYLRPTRKHVPVEAFITPQQFESYREAARIRGFALVSSGPLVRSSYRAADADVRALIEARKVMTI